MKDQHASSHHNPKRSTTNIFSRLYTNPTSYVVFLIFCYAIVLICSYCFGYLAGSSFSTSDISTFVISKTLENPQPADTRGGSEIEPIRHPAQCADPVPPEHVRQMIIDQVYNGTSPYEDFTPPRISLLLGAKRIKGWDSYGAIYKKLINKVRPKVIIKLSTFLGTSATFMANLTSELGLKTQILCFDDFQSWPGDLFEDIAMPTGDDMNLDQFMKYVISQNATESILPVPLSTTAALEKLCEWGVFGDLIEVDAGHDFHSAWSDINSAYKLLRPGGILFGHNYFSSYYNRGVRQAVRLFARVNKFRVKANRQHWMIDSA